MAISIVVTATAGSATGTNVTTGAVDTTGATGLVLIASTYAGGGAVDSISDSKGNTWTALTPQATSFPRVTIYYSIPTSVGSGHTFTNTVTAGFPSLAVYALAGTHATTFYDSVQSGANSNSGAATSLQPGSVTPSQANCIVITGFGNDPGAGSLAIDSSFSTPLVTTYLAANHEGVGAAYIIQTSASAVNPTWSWSGGARASAPIAVFRAAAAGGSIIINPLTGPLGPVGYIGGR